MSLTSLLKPIYESRFLKPLTDRLRGKITKGSGCRISRRSILRTVNGGMISIGGNCSVHDFAMIMTYGGDISIGDNCSVNPFSILYGHGGLRIGNGVRIAAHVVIIPASHKYADAGKFIYEQGESHLGIVIEDDVWIGAGARILDGVTIGRGAVVGSGAVVTKDVQPYSVVVGVPARAIKSRR
ncbi:MAG: acyltransferase [Nitrospirae bacterium]|nr:acyltransferase [Nitrospirota bacterium]